MDLKKIKLKGGNKENMKTKIKQERGITLIALVVTIVVLLILAGVSINAVFNDNGIIKRAQEAQNKMDEAQQNDLNAIGKLDDWLTDMTENDGVEEKEETATAWTGTVATSYSSGDGSKANPYQISSAEELAYLAKQVNEGNDYSGRYFMITTDIDLSESYWVPIGNGKSRAFKGSVEGAGNTINNILIKGDYNYRGLFGHTGEGCIIKNLSISAGKIEGASYVGGLTGYSKSTKIESVIVRNIEFKATKYLGGISGRSKLSTFENITVQDVSFSDANYVGGIVGYTDTKTFDNCTIQVGDVTNCENYGDYASGINKE